MQHNTKTADAKILPRSKMNLVDKSKPDFILLNGTVVTVDEQFSVAQTFAIKGGRC
jgi:hypothetical protein